MVSASTSCWNSYFNSLDDILRPEGVRQINPTPTPGFVFVTTTDRKPGYYACKHVDPYMTPFWSSVTLCQVPAAKRIPHVFPTLTLSLVFWAEHFA